MQSLLGDNSSQVADGKRVRLRFSGFVVVAPVDAQRDHMDLVSRNVQVVGHEVGVITAHGDEGIHRADIGTDQLQGSFLEALGKAL